MFTKHKLFEGAVILTAAGFITRFMGFFFRIFLSHAFGEENVGLYQLVFPAYALCLSLSTAGIQTAVSRMVAERASLGREKEAKSILYTALSLTLLISFIEILLIQQNASLIAQSFLGDARCEDLLIIISYALPCAATHSCICGYSFGLQKAALPALSQLVEQVLRILFVVVLFLYMKQNGEIPSIRIAAAGIVAGEFSSALFSSFLLSGQKSFPHRPPLIPAMKNLREILNLSIPLTANRTAVTLLQSIEAASIPACLKMSGMNTSEALSMYGVLTGMALPCILFPSAITNSVSTVLMPAVSAAQASGNRPGIICLLRKGVGSCLILGLSSCLFFIIFGNPIGSILFHSPTAGKFILTLAWICPFMYTNSALLSAINGFGKTTFTFLINMTGLFVRIGGVFFVIPEAGIQGYLWSLLVSQLLMCTFSLLALLSLVRPGLVTAGK